MTTLVNVVIQLYVRVLYQSCTSLYLNELIVSLLKCILKERLTIIVSFRKQCVFVAESSLDIRDRSLQDGSHWSEKRILGGRAYYTTEPPYSFLILESVKEEDAGVYRCRVDFKISPTRNSLVNLTIIGEYS